MVFNLEILISAQLLVIVSGALTSKLLVGDRPKLFVYEHQNNNQVTVYVADKC